MHLRQLFDRWIGLRNTDTPSSVPPVCFSECNAAYDEAARVGLAAGLCVQNGTFLVDYKVCSDCIAANSLSNTNTTLVSILAPYIQYCAENPAPGVSSDSGAQSTIDAEAALVTSLLSELASEGHTVTQTVTPTPTGTTQNPAAQTSGATSNPTSNPLAKSTSQAWIAGAVIGPIVLVLAIAAIIFLMRRRKRQEETPLPRDPDPKEKDMFLQYKAQLHSDSIVRPQEMDGAEPRPEPSELPAVERPGELENRI